MIENAREVAITAEESLSQAFEYTVHQFVLPQTYSGRPACEDINAISAESERGTRPVQLKVLVFAPMTAFYMIMVLGRRC